MRFLTTTICCLGQTLGGVSRLEQATATKRCYTGCLGKYVGSSPWRGALSSVLQSSALSLR